MLKLVQRFLWVCLLLCMSSVLVVRWVLDSIVTEVSRLIQAPTGLNGRPSTEDDRKNGVLHSANRPGSEDKRLSKGALTTEGQPRASHHDTSLLLPLPLTSSSQQEPDRTSRQNNSTRKRVSTSDVPNFVNARPTTLTKSASDPAFVVDGKQQKYVIEIHLSPTQEVVAEDQKVTTESVEDERESVFLEGSNPSVVLTSPEKRQRNPFTRSQSLPVSPIINIVPCGDMHDKSDPPSSMAEVEDTDDDWTRVVPRVLQKSDSIAVPQSSNSGPFRRLSRSRTDSMSEALTDEGRIEMADKEELRRLDIDKDREVIHDIAYFLETQNEKPNSLPPDSILVAGPYKIQNLEAESQSLPSSPMSSRRVGRHSLRSLPVSPHPENQPERSRSSTDSLDEQPRTNFLTTPVQPVRPVTPKPYKKPASSSPSSSSSHLSVNSPPPARPVTPKPHSRPSSSSLQSLSPKSSLLDIPQEDSLVMRPISPKFATITETTDVKAPQARLSAEPQSTGSPQLARSRSRKTALSAKQNHVLMRISAAGSEDSGLGDSQSQLNLAVPSSEDKSLQKDAPTVHASEDVVRYRRATKQRRRRPKSDLGSWVQKAPTKSRRPLTIHGTPHQESIEENRHSDEDNTDGKSLDKLTSLREAINLFTADSPRLNRRNTVHNMLGSPKHPGNAHKMSGVSPAIKEESTTPRVYMRTVSAYSPPMGTPALKRSRSTPCSLDRAGRRRIHSIADKGTGTPRSSTVSVELSSPSSDSEGENEATSVPSSPAVNRRSSFTGIPPGQDIDEMFEDEDEVTYAEALWDHVTMDPDELAFRAGEVIEVTDLNDKDWWWGCIEDREGWFPAAFVRLRVNQEDTVEDYVAKMRQGTSVNLRRYSVSFSQNKDQMRSNVVNEILSTERDYIGHLRDIIEGYVKQCRKRPEMFSCETIKTVFGNIEEIYQFQTSFLQTLEHSSRQDLPHLSEVGKCFLQHREGFEIYSEYCNNHPNAVTELNQIMKSKKYRHFFEACRLLQNMIDLALDGFLLTPVQKICKYPLQLAELLKYTKPEHRDYEDVKAALEAMKDVANLINERKRRLENIDKIAAWQQDVEGWEGDDVLDRSSQLIYNGDVRVITTARGKVQDRTLFLFDHQMVFCKKDLLKRDCVAYKERMLTGPCQVKPIPDGKDKELQTSVKNALKLYDMDKEKTYILCLKTPEQKMRWQEAFQEEREKVTEDKKKGFEIPLDVRKNAMNKSFRNKPCKPRADYRRLSKKYEVSEPSLQHVSLPRGISSKEVFAEVKQKRSIILPFFNFATKKSSRKASALT
ncbi:ARHGEF9 [Branchiostoma lanceolatum]|uniref:ARHGEF9 protein n=1 Tax=Branchiostoma lanceolatum TaxID=7740 RepID=A0A8K0EEA7_BRALA|nr:ARHGEF9 [Branchiostoma lanceolatum]